MKRIVLIVFILLSAITLRGQIIADHSIVEDYDIIPQQYIDSVKKRIAGWDGEAETTYTADHYCAPDGDDVTGDGSYANPWQTLTKAVSEATAGDTVYFRGGVYDFDDYTYINGKNGTGASPICFFNYPGETPIFDYTSYVASGNNFAIHMNNSDYIYFRGITVRNVNQAYDQNFLGGIYGYDCLNMKLTNMTVHHIQGKGIRLYNCSAEIINCDAYRCYDPLRSDSFPGNGGTGINVGSDDETFLTYYIYGCRSWENADQGFSGSGYGTATYENCWSWNNAPADMELTGPGLGSGFKFGLIYSQGTTLTVKNCISAYNPHGGFNNNAASAAPTNEYWYNNTAYECNTGFTILQTIAGEWDPIELILRNNICYSFDESYQGDHYNFLENTARTDDHNSWNGGITLSSTDWVSLDTAQLRWARKSDGSLPDITFLTLAETSDMIDAGIDVGISYNGTAPDLGAFESEYTAIVAINNPYAGVDFDEYYKSNFHAHTTESDGSATPIIQINALADAGYDIIAITDHDYYGTPGTTWPWTTWITEDPSVVYSNGAMEIAAFYPDLGPDGVLAIRGSELSWFNHVASIFSDVDYTNTPGSLANSIAAVAAKDGFVVFAHPLDYDQTAAWYNTYFDSYYGTALGIDVFTASTSDSTSTYFNSTSELWDAINATRSPDSLVWGFSNLDRHSNLTGFRNYNYHFVDTLTDVAIRDNLINGAFTFSFQPAADLTGAALAPRLSGVSVEGTLITLTTSDCGSVSWFDDTSTLIETGSVIDVSLYSTNYVRAVLHNSYGRTFTQPFALNAAPDIDSTATDILAFTLPTQTGSATINTTNHTVAIEVTYTADVTALTPTITLSYGATVIPASGVSQNFTSPVTYTVTALDGTTTQEWVVTVTQAEEPAAPAVSSRIVKYRGLILKL